VLETSIAVYGVGIALGRKVDLTKQRQLFLFVGFAVLLGPLVASILAGIVLHVFHGTPFTVPLQWFPASALGMAVVVPVLLGLSRDETRELFSRGRILNTLFYLGLVAVATFAIFSRADFPWLFFIFPPLLFLVVRFGLSGGVLGCCVVAAIGTWFTVNISQGPLVDMANTSLEHRILLLQLFLAMAVLSVSLVAIVFTDLKRATLCATRSEERYRELAAALEALAREDGLTGLANRRQFDRVLVSEWRRAAQGNTPISLLLFDVDSFKKFNDAHGHLRGDHCLRTVSQVATSVARRSGDTIARFGGDEFAMILPETPLDAAVGLAERMRALMEKKAIEHPASEERVVTISVGCATIIPEAAMDVTYLMTAADKALYAAKRAGCNRVEWAQLPQRQLQ
jgi:diguanylate cyclase (GGDEF)-like protein